MKKKLILITLIGGILSIIIYVFTQNNEITIMSIGDGLSSGETPYGIEGYSFNERKVFQLWHFTKEHLLRTMKQNPAISPEQFLCPAIPSEQNSLRRTI